MNYVRCDDEFDVIDEFKMPLIKDAWLDLDISHELDILGAEIVNGQLVKRRDSE